MNMNLQHLGQHGDGVQHVLIVGANARSEHLVGTISGKGSHGCLIEGFVDDNPDRKAILENLGVRYLGPIDALNRLMIERVIDSVYVCLPLRSSYDTAQRVLNLCEEAGVPVFMVADLLPLHAKKGPMWCMGPQYAANLVEHPQEEPAFALKSALTPLFAALSAAMSAAFLGLIYAVFLVSGQLGGGNPQSPFSL